MRIQVRCEDERRTRPNYLIKTTRIMKRKNATILISICMVVKALNIALLATSIIDKDWFLFVVGFILYICCQWLTKELEKMKEEQDLTI